MHALVVELALTVGAYLEAAARGRTFGRRWLWFHLAPLWFAWLVSCSVARRGGEIAAPVADVNDLAAADDECDCLFPYCDACRAFLAECIDPLPDPAD